MKGHTSSRTPSAIVRSNLPTLVTPHVLIPRVLPIDFLHKNLYLWTFSKESDIRRVWKACESHGIICQNIKWYLLQTLLYVLYNILHCTFSISYWWRIYISETLVWSTNGFLNYPLVWQLLPQIPLFPWANYLSFYSSNPKNWSVKLTNQFFTWICRDSSQK